MNFIVDFQRILFTFIKIREMVSVLLLCYNWKVISSDDDLQIGNKRNIPPDRLEVSIWVNQQEWVN